MEVAPPPPPAPQRQREKPGQTLPRVRLGKYVQTLEEQLQTLRLENQTFKDELGQLRSKESDWQKRSLEMFRLLDKMRRNESPGDVLSAKKHFTQLVAPLGIGVIEPEPGIPLMKSCTRRKTCLKTFRNNWLWLSAWSGVTPSTDR